MILSPFVRRLLRYLALAYILVLVVVPVGLILWRYQFARFRPGCSVAVYAVEVEP